MYYQLMMYAYVPTHMLYITLLAQYPSSYNYLSLEKLLKFKKVTMSCLHMCCRHVPNMSRYKEYQNLYHTYFGLSHVPRVSDTDTTTSRRVGAS